VPALLLGRRPEADGVDAGRAHTAGDGTYGAVLTAAVHGLQQEQDPIATVALLRRSEETFLVRRQISPYGLPLVRGPLFRVATYGLVVWESRSAARVDAREAGLTRSYRQQVPQIGHGFLPVADAH
jgi:hypothetical protein